MTYLGNSLAAQWLRVHTSTAGSVDLILGQQTRILHAAQHSQKKEKYTYIHIIYTHMRTHTSVMFELKGIWTQEGCVVCVRVCVCMCMCYPTYRVTVRIKRLNTYKQPEQYLSHKFAVPIVIIAVAAVVKWGK